MLEGFVIQNCIAWNLEMLDKAKRQLTISNLPADTRKGLEADVARYQQNINGLRGH